MRNRLLHIQNSDIGTFIMFCMNTPTKHTCAIGVSLLLLGLAAQADINEPFGLSTVVISEGPLSATWADLQIQMQSEKRVIAQCRAEPHSCNSPAALRFIAIAKAGDPYEGLVRISHINRAVNLAISSVTDPCCSKNVDITASYARGRRRRLQALRRIEVRGAAGRGPRAG